MDIFKIYYKRIKLIAYVFLILFIGLSIRLYYLQVHPTQIVQGDLQNHQTEYISKIKYSILDTNGKNMLNYNKKYVMVLDTKPFKLNNYEETLEDLLALNFIMKSEDSKFNYTDIMKEEGKIYYNITEETYEKLKKLDNIKGIYCYKYDDLDMKEGWKIENFIASINAENVIEGSFQDTIMSYVEDNSYPSISFNLNDKSIYDNGTININDENKNLKLTLDSQWEDKIRDVLLRDDYSFLTNIGVVLLESETGKIRAMVQKDETAANINLGIGNLGYEPGSIFKLITEAIALDLGIIDTSDVFTCEGEICTKSGESYAHGPLTVEEAIQISCNDVFAKIGAKIGYEKMLEYTTNLGLYSKVLGLSGENKEEAEGVKPTYADGVSNFSIGQCLTVTPLQIAGAINAIVNDGIYIKPYLVEEILDDDDNLLEETSKEEKRIFSTTTSKIVQNSMYDVIWKGTGYEAKVEGINQGGKTGTSTGEGGATNHGWFAGYFEMNDKKYTLVIVAPNIGDMHPDGRELGGGNTGAPIFRDIINTLIK